MKQYNIEQPQNVVVKIVFLILLVNYTSSIASAEMQHLSQSSYCRLLAEAVEKVSCQAARGFARFDFTGDERHQRPSQRLYALSGQGFGCICRSPRVDNAEHRSVGKKFRALGRQPTFSTASASCRPNEGSVGASALPLRCDMEIGMSAFPKLAIA
jgi:hypothetical protein